MPLVLMLILKYARTHYRAHTTRICSLCGSRVRNRR